MWGYLSEFWSAITQVVIEAGVYTIEWFQSIGNAVAGAIGNLFNWLLHYINDLFVFLGWFFSNLKEVLLTFFLPLNYIFTFLKNLVVSAFAPPPASPLEFTFASSVFDFFDVIPYFSYVIGAVVVALGIFFVFAIVRLFLHIK